MPDNRRLRRLLAYVFAVPVIAVAYGAAFGGRLWSAMRPLVATILGATVIGGVYVHAAFKRAPATPMRAAASFALAVVLLGPNVAPAPVYAANDPAQAVIAAAEHYLGHRYQSGAEGPRYFDCSGLVFRAFSDAGELPRIGGMRLLSQGYMRWFVSRGLFTTDQTQAVPGDLVVWNNGSHIGIYLGDGKAISALTNPWGVKIHGLHWIGEPVTYFLTVDYSNGNGGGNGNSDNNGNGNTDNNGGTTGDGAASGGGDRGSTNNDNNGGISIGAPVPAPVTPEPVTPDTSQTDPGSALAGGKQGSNEKGGMNGSAFDVVTNAGATGQTPVSDTAAPTTSGPRAGQAIGTGHTTATLEIHEGPHADSRVIGWISRNVDFTLVGQTKSGGWLWLQIQLINGKTGWVWAYWTNLRQ